MKLQIPKITFKTSEGEKVEVDTRNIGYDEKIQPEELKKVSECYFIVGEILAGGLQKVTKSDEYKIDVITFQEFGNENLEFYHVYINDKKVIREVKDFNFSKEEEIFIKKALIFLKFSGALLASGLKGMEAVAKNYYDLGFHL